MVDSEEGSYQTYHLILSGQIRGRVLEIELSGSLGGPNVAVRKASIPIPIQVTTGELRKGVDSLLRWWRSRDAKRAREVAQRGRESPYLIPVLRKMYPSHSKEFLRIGDVTFPVLAFPSSKSQLEDSESVLGKRNLETVTTVEDGLVRGLGNGVIKSLLKQGRKLEDKPTYCLEELHAGSEGVRLDCSMGTYFDNVRSSFILDSELLVQLGRVGMISDLESFIFHMLPVRRHVHQLAGSEDPVMTPQGRRAAIGITTITLFNTSAAKGGTYEILIGHRSAKGVAAEEDLIDTVPAGIFQPVVKRTIDEFSVKHNVFREYLEEIFGIREAETPPPGSFPDYLYGNPNLHFLMKMIKRNEAKIVPAGIAMNLLNLRADICVLLWIGSTKWRSSHGRGRGDLDKIQFNDEWNGKLPNAINAHEIYSHFFENAKYPFDCGNMHPPGAAAIDLGLKAAKHLNLIA